MLVDDAMLKAISFPVEEWLYQESVGAPKICPKRRGVDQLEQRVVRRAVVLARPTYDSGLLTLADGECTFEEPRVMNFVMTAGRARANTWLELRAGLSVSDKVKHHYDKV